MPAPQFFRRKAGGALIVMTLAASAVISTGVSAAQAAELPATFVDTASTTWDYSDNNTDPAQGAANRLVWTTGDYDASGWKHATGAFGAKGGKATGLGAAFPVNTLLTQYIEGTSTDVPTFHFRTSFSVDAQQLSEMTGLEATVTYDDAIQVFVNGQKVAGFVDSRVEAVPENQRNLTYAGNSAGDPVTSTFTIDPSVLSEGTNTLAVALYQDRASSSDIYFNFTSLTPMTAPIDTTANYSDVVLTIGANETSRNVTWYTDSDTEQVLQYAVGSADEAFPTAGVTTVPAIGGATTSGEFNRRAAIAGLAENTSYVYRVGSEATGWSTVHGFATESFSGDTEFLFFGDPQIGASGNTASDGAGWADTLNVAMAAYPKSELLFSSGDQVNSASDETQYQYYTAPDQLTSIPTVPMIGNHDVGSKAYEQHFTVPNLDPNAGAATSGTSSGGDYWFTYKGILYVVLNTNSSDTASHIAFMQDVVAQHGADATWKVLAFHHSIYSVASHVNDTQIKNFRADLPQAISDLGFDLVLQGHDHSYTRTYLVKDGVLANANEVPGQSEVRPNAGEVLYITANSASGSKYYDVKAPDAWYASVINQEKTRNYTHLTFTDNAITVTTLRSQAHGESEPVNSVVDEVTLVRGTTPTDPDEDPTPVPDESGNVFFQDDVAQAVARTAMSVASADQVISGDWDGDGVDTPALRTGTTYTFLASNRTGAAEKVVDLGAGIPVVGDFNADGLDDIALRSVDSNVFSFIYNVNGSIPAGVVNGTVRFGKATDIPLAGDWYGNGSDFIGVQRGNQFLLADSLSSPAHDIEFLYGRAGDTAIVGDFDGDGRDTIAVARGNVVYVKNTLAKGDADSTVKFGRTDDLRVAGNWFGTGTDTLAAYRR